MWVGRLSCSFVFFSERENIDSAGENGNDWRSYLRGVKKIKQICSHMFFSLSLLQKLNLILSALVTVLLTIMKGWQWIFISSVTICLYFHVPAYLERYFENKGVCYNPSLDGKLWNCELYLLPMSYLRVFHRDCTYPVSFQADWVIYCNGFFNVTDPKTAGKDTPKYRNPSKKIVGINPWSDNI